MIYLLLNYLLHNKVLEQLLITIKINNMQASSNLETIYVTESDTPKPPTNTEFPRLYGHLLCPFVEKVRMALAARGVKYQGCEVDLGKKT